MIHALAADDQGYLKAAVQEEMSHYLLEESLTRKPAAFTTFDQFLHDWAKGSITGGFWNDAGDKGFYTTNTALAARLDVPLSRCGRLRATAGLELRRDGAVIRFSHSPFDHYAT